MSKGFLGRLALFGTAFIWGTSFVILKTTLDSIGALWVLAIRFTISALLLGLGQYGTEMLKALAWFGQMDGYDLRLTAVDARPNARELFTYRCPELMDRQHNGRCIPGEAQYDIRIHAGMRLESREFLELVQTLPQLTYVFVALGSDTRNIEAAVRLRRRIETLRPMLTQCRKLSHLTAHYYDPDFWRYGEYSL